MKMIFVKDSGSTIYEDESVVPYTVTGRTEDMTELRNKGFIVHREELDNQPIYEGFLGPMWDGDRLRYETSSVYRMLSI